MRAPGEGDVASAVTGKTFGGHGEESGLTENMEEKTRHHEDALHGRGERTGKDIEGEGSEGWTGKKGEVDLGKRWGAGEPPLCLLGRNEVSAQAQHHLVFLPPPPRIPGELYCFRRDGVEGKNTVR